MVRPIATEIHAVLPYTAKNICPTLFHTLKKSNFDTSQLYYLIQRNNKILLHARCKSVLNEQVHNLHYLKVFDLIESIK